MYTNFEILMLNCSLLLFKLEKLTKKEISVTKNVKVTIVLYSDFKNV